MKLRKQAGSLKVRESRGAGNTYLCQHETRQEPGASAERSRLGHSAELPAVVLWASAADPTTRCADGCICLKSR